jgi:hypothetical protein
MPGSKLSKQIATVNLTLPASTRETANLVKQSDQKNIAFLCFLLNPSRFSPLPGKSDLWQSCLHW